MGVWITEDLLRKSSEHNDCIIGSMEEVALHQREIDRITLLNSACRELRIIYLQNNNIKKIENVNRLKELRYLNLAINQIRRFEGLHRCEFLGKLDMTLNMIDARGLLTVERLAANTVLRELFMTGNPCCQIVDTDGVDVYRPFVISVVPSLQQLDGKEVLKSERTQAQQVFAHCRAVIEAQAEQEQRQAEVEGETRHWSELTSDEDEDEDDEDSDIEEIESEAVKKKRELKERVKATKAAEKARKEREEQEEAQKASQFEGFGSKPNFKPKTPGLDRGPDGKVRQCNEGHYKFRVDERDDVILVELKISKYLDTSLLEVDVHPDFVRITVKGKVTQLHLPQEVRTDTAFSQRSTTTGALLVTCPRLYPVMRKQPLVGTTTDEKQPGGKYVRAKKVAAGVGSVEQPTETLADNTNFRRIHKDSPCVDLTADIKEAKAAAEPAPRFDYRDSEIDDDAPPAW